MGYIIAGFVALVALLVLGITKGAHNAKYGIGQKVKVQFHDSETGRTIHAGNGNSIGAAIVDGFSKMWYSVSISSREDTIKSKLDSMNRTLSENRSRMLSGDIAQCEQYINCMSDLLSQKEAERQRVKRERLEKEKNMTAQRRFIAQQRHLMTDSIRYDVMRRDNFRCVLCGATADDGVKLHVDHIFPVSRGGKTEMSNLRTLCERCNMGKSDKIEMPASVLPPKEPPESRKLANSFLQNLDSCNSISAIHDLWVAAMQDKSVTMPTDCYGILANRLKIACSSEQMYGISSSATEEIKMLLREAMPR